MQNNSDLELLKYKISKYEHKYNQLSNQSGGNMSREELDYKIAKYEHKYNQLSNQSGGNMSREELEYKIAKYEHKYNQLSNQSGGNMSREELEYKIAKYEHKFNKLTNQDGGSAIGITLGTLAAAGIGYYAYKYYNDPLRNRAELLKRVKEILKILENIDEKGSTDSNEINDNLQIHTFTNLILKNDLQETKDELNKIIQYLKIIKEEILLQFLK